MNQDTKKYTKRKLDKRAKIRRLMSLSFFFSLLMILAAGNQQSTANVCGEKQCSPHGPKVRFPFVLHGEQPEHCGSNISSFNLYCDNRSRTILQLPSYKEVEVTTISYLSQMLEVRPLESCLGLNLRYIDISTTPFWHGNSNKDYKVEQYSLFTCKTFTHSEGIDFDWNGDLNAVETGCLESNSEYTIYAFRKSRRIRYVAEFLRSCTKMYETMWDGSKLSWSLPLCARCEEQGGICGWQSGSTNRIGCLGGKKHQSGTLKKLEISGSIIGCLFLILGTSAMYFSHSKKTLNREDQIRLRKFLEDYRAMKPTRYSFADIKKITNDFKDKLGEGGCGNVYKGKVSNKIYVAVKLLHDSAENGEEFINEVGTMARIHHVNVVRLLGFCADGYNKVLVYEFLPNGSLDKFIFPNGKDQQALGMERLLDIAIGIARGINYLHQGCEQRILHFDIKPHNILLDKNYNPKISDFGLAKLCEKGKSAVSMTAARGTMGYIAPEVFSRYFGTVSFKSDIYSFGMLLLEMVGRRKNTENNAENISQVYFPEWIYGRLGRGEDLRIQVDDEEDGEDHIIAKKLAIVGLWCIQWNPVNRPSITVVLQMLEGIAENLTLPPNPFASDKVVNPGDPTTPPCVSTLRATRTRISSFMNFNL